MLGRVDMGMNTSGHGGRDAWVDQWGLGCRVNSSMWIQLQCDQGNEGGTVLAQVDVGMVADWPG